MWDELFDFEGRGRRNGPRRGGIRGFFDRLLGGGEGDHDTRARRYRDDDDDDDRYDGRRGSDGRRRRSPERDFDLD